MMILRVILNNKYTDRIFLVDSIGSASDYVEQV